MRVDGWESKLMTWVQDAQQRPFRWGEWDCALAATDCVMLLTGDDLGADFRGHYSTHKGSLRTIKNLGYDGLKSIATDRLGEPLVTPKLAQRGDVVLAKTDNGQALLICIGTQAVGPGESGMVSVEMDHCLKAWRV